MLLYASGSKIPNVLNIIKKFEYASTDQVKNLQKERLEKLLLHTYQNVPYYHDVLPKNGVVVNNKVKLDNFFQIPILTKKIIREQGGKLYSQDYRTRKPYFNTSGGSTGEPIRFIQDKDYDDWNNATKLYFNHMLGKELGDKEIKFWGSDRDIIEGSLSHKDRIINWLYNRKFFNSYRLDEKALLKLIHLNNRFKPKAYWSYMESALELSRFLSEHNISFHAPEILISTIAPLTEEIRSIIEKYMKCNVYNQYGSREVGGIGCECKEQKWLHTFPWYQYVEVLNHENMPIANEEGNVTVTNLCNYSMPLIRYQLGDVAVGDEVECSCGRNTYVLKDVLGRTLGYFKKKDGSLVHSHFLVQALFFRDWIKMFQIIQEKVNKIIIKIEKSKGLEPNRQDIQEVVDKTKILMGESCEISIEYVNKIEKIKNGKYLYTISKLT
jgi:phenylacetate-CoA ligase